MSCAFCRLLEQSAAEREYYDSVLMESKHFSVIPAVGPLVRGHVLAVGKTHTLSLLQTGEHGIADYVDVVEAVNSKYGELGILEAEHGATQPGTIGGCLDHVHVHILPGLQHLQDEIARNLSLIAHGQCLAELINLVPEPYILTRVSGSFRLFKAPEEPSQLIRRRLAKVLGNANWDWAADVRSELVVETIGMWR